MAIFVAILCFVLYLPSINGELVYDAAVQITSDDYIHTPSNLIDVFSFRVMSRDVLDFNRPVHLQFLMLDSLIYGRNPVGYRLTSIMLHVINTALLSIILVSIITDYRRSRGKSIEIFSINIIAAFSALLFAVHPAIVEAVAEPSFREDPLSTFFTLLALFLATRLRSEGKHQRWHWVGIIVSSLYAIGAKEIGIVAPLLIAGYFLLIRRSGFNRMWLIPVIGGLVVCGGFTIARFALEPEKSVIFGDGPPQFANEISSYFKQQILIWRLYLEAYFHPTRLCADYTPNSVRDFSANASWSLVIGFVLVQIVLSCFSRVAAFGAIIFWLAILPISNILPQFHPAADRYLYMPLIGLAITASVILEWIVSIKVLRGAIMVFVLGVFGVLIPMNLQRQSVFKTEIAFWTDTLDKNKDSYNAMNSLGYAYLYKNNLDEAQKWLEKANQINPRHPDPYCGLAIIFDKRGQKNYAMFLFEKCVRANPDYATPDVALKKMRVDKRQAEQIQPLAARFKQQQSN